MHPLFRGNSGPQCTPSSGGTQGPNAPPLQRNSGRQSTPSSEELRAPEHPLFRGPGGPNPYHSFQGNWGVQTTPSCLGPRTKPTTGNRGPLSSPLTRGTERLKLYSIGETRKPEDHLTRVNRLIKILSLKSRPENCTAPQRVMKLDFREYENLWIKWLF